jgi:hypothetical protein
MCFKVCERITARPGRKFGYKVVNRQSYDVTGNKFKSLHRFGVNKNGTRIETLYSLGVESRIKVRKGTKETREKVTDWCGKEGYNSTRGFYIYPSIRDARDNCKGRTIIKVAVKPKDFLYEGVRRRGFPSNPPQATYRAITPVQVVS